MPKKRVKKEKPMEEMHDRELAEYLVGKPVVDRLHEEFDLRDTSDRGEDESIPKG